MQRDNENQQADLPSSSGEALIANDSETKKERRKTFAGRAMVRNVP